METLDKAMKRKEKVVEYGSESKTNDESTSRVMLDLELFNSGSSRASEVSNEDGRQGVVEPKVFTCSFCKREFSTSQALGGHQNAHKQERASVKKRHGGLVNEAAVTPPLPLLGGHSAYSYHPYSGFHQRMITFYGTLDRLAGRVPSDPMTHKQSYNSWFSSRPFFMNSSPSSHDHRVLVQNNYQKHQMSGGFGQEKSEKGNATVFLRLNSVENTAKINKAMEGNNQLQLQLGNANSDQTDASGIDLNLKL